MAFFTNKNRDNRFGRIALIVAFIAAIVVFCSSLTHVPVGSVGVQTNMSKVTGRTYSSGWYFKAPFAVQVHSMSIRQQTIEYDTIEGELSGKEIINMKLKLVYSLNSDKAAYVYENYGENYIDTLMPQAEVFDVIKSVVANYDIESVRSSRDKIMSEARDALQERFGERGVTITSLALSNYNFGDLEASINAEVQAKQERKTVAEQNQLALEKAENDKKVAEIAAEQEAQVKLTQAQADADAALIKAQGEADAIKAKADAQADANKKIAESLTPELLEQQKYEKWNGAVPNTVLGGDSDSVYVID